jgi:hypothetical protein
MTEITIEHLLQLSNTQVIVMKIVEHTKQSLELTDQNHQCLWGLLFATPFLAIGLGMAVATAKVVTLECQRAVTTHQITCQRKVAGILGTTTDQIPGQLKTTTVVKSSGTGVVLGTTTGKVELAPYRSLVMSQHYENADRVNAFIKDSQQTNIRVEQDDRLGNSLFILNFLLGGVGVALVSLAIPLQMNCKFDRSNNQVTLDKKYLLYGNRQAVLPLAEIQQAKLNKRLFYINHNPVYNIKLVTFAKKKVSLSVPSQNLSIYQEIVDVTNDFLHPKSA